MQRYMPPARRSDDALPRESGAAAVQRFHAGSDRLQAMQRAANNAPQVRALMQMRALLAPAAPMGGTIQRMRWFKRGSNLEPVDPRFPGPPPLPGTMDVPGLHEWNEGDVWDDTNGNIYDGRTGFLITNRRLPVGNDALLPEDIRRDVDALNQPNDLSTKRKQDRYRLGLNKISGRIRVWLDGVDPADPRVRDYKVAADRARARIDAMQEFSMYGADAALLPTTGGARAALAHGLAAERLYGDVHAAGVLYPGTHQVEQIDSRVSDAALGPQETIDTGTLMPQGGGLQWWASAAMGLRAAAATAGRGGLLHLPVGTGHVPIGLRQDPLHLAGEFIVLGHDAPVVHDVNPDRAGLRTPSSAGPEHRVSYPAFRQRLQAIHSAAAPANLLNDQAIAGAMLAMVRNPGADPAAVLAADLPALRELLATWLVAEPARHRSSIFNGVLGLQQIADGHGTFEAFLEDDGRHPMTGAGTAAAGRQAEREEANVMMGRNIGDPAAVSRVVRRQYAQLGTLNPGGDNLAAPLEGILRQYGAGNVTLRTIPNA
jgi:hypothetical protein